MGKTFAILGDVHAPYCNKKTLTKIFDVIQKNKPDYIIQIGDLYDFLSFSRFPRNVNIVTPNQEIMDGRVTAEEIWRIVKKRSPKSICYQIKGNHCDRPMRRVLEKFPEIASLVSTDHLWKFDGVNTILDSREELVINDIIFMHGFRGKLGDHAKFNQQSTVCGHSHRGGVHFFPLKDKILFELNAGYCADPNSEALSYSLQKIVNWTQGMGFIDEYGPRFIPL